MQDVAEQGTTTAVGMAAGQEPSASPGVDVVPAPPTREDPASSKELSRASSDSSKRARPQPTAVESDDNKPRKGRPVAGTARSEKTLRDKWRNARTEDAKRSAIIFARQHNMLEVLDGKALRWALDEGLLTERQVQMALGVAPARQAQPAAPASAPTGPGAPVGAPGTEAPAGGAQAPAPAAPAPGASPVPTSSTPAAQPPPPPVPMYMGQPAERVAMFAGMALPVLGVLAEKFGAAGFDPTKHTKATLFRGTPIERTVDCVPLERMAELAGVVAAEKWPATGGDTGGAGSAKTELLVLGVATFGPAAVAAGKRALGALWSLGRGIGARVKGRRGLAVEVAE